MSLFLALVCTPGLVSANPAPIPMAGGSVSAKLPHETIRMDAEEVTVRLGKATYTVDAVYRMANTGEAATEWVGFPRGLERDRHEGTEFPNFIQFHVWVDGKRVPFSKEGKQWLAGQVNFPGHATTIIRVVYEAHYPARYLYRGYRYAEYIVGTGSLWKDRIGTAIFTVDGSEIGGTKSFDASLKAPQSNKLRSENVVRFDVSDFKPEPDATLYIEFRNRREADAR